MTQGYAGVESGRDETVAQGVGRDPFHDPGPTSQAAHDAGRAVSVEALPGTGEEHRSVVALADGRVDCPGDTRWEWDHRNL